MEEFELMLNLEMPLVKSDSKNLDKSSKSFALIVFKNNEVFLPGL